MKLILKINLSTLYFKTALLILNIVWIYYSADGVNCKARIYLCPIVLTPIDRYKEIQEKRYGLHENLGY